MKAILINALTLLTMPGLIKEPESLVYEVDIPRGMENMCIRQFLKCEFWERFQTQELVDMSTRYDWCVVDEEGHLKTTPTILVRTPWYPSSLLAGNILLMRFGRTDTAISLDLIKHMVSTNSISFHLA